MTSNRVRLAAALQLAALACLTPMLFRLTPATFLLFLLAGLPLTAAAMGLILLHLRSEPQAHE